MCIVKALQMFIFRKMYCYTLFQVFLTAVLYNNTILCPYNQEVCVTVLEIRQVSNCDQFIIMVI